MEVEMTKPREPWKQRFSLLLTLISLLLIAGSAGAAGRVEWKSKTLKESDGHSWTIEVAFYLNKAPDVATMPMRFSFQPVMYYERSLLDGKEGPQLRQVPLVGKAPLVESVDVGFMDPGSGAIQKRTKFSFKVTRGHGYEAGEYDVTIKDGSTDQALGAATRIIFQGDNEVIDRRAMVFSGEKKKKDKDKEGEDGDKAEGGGGGGESQSKGSKQLDESDPAFWEGGPKKKSPAEEEYEVDQKRGCGCRLAGSGLSDHTAALGLGLVALAAARRRKRVA
jgi:MYXO-CTERM domain-containing protein